MTQYELEQSRAKRYAWILTTKTNLHKENKIYVSVCSKNNNEIKFSIRLNELANRVNDIDMVTTLFLIKELESAEYNQKPTGLKISQTTAEIFWPAKNKLKGWYSSFLHITNPIGKFEIDNGMADSIIHSCKKWYTPEEKR